MPLTGVQAQSTDASSLWAQCEADELARDIMPVTPNLPPVDDLPIQAEADRAESSPSQSILEGNVSLTRGDQRLRADRISPIGPPIALRLKTASPIAILNRRCEANKRKSI